MLDNWLKYNTNVSLDGKVNSNDSPKNGDGKT